MFPAYEAFASVVDGTVDQYAKWLKMSREVSWRTPVSRRTCLFTGEGLAPGTQQLQPSGTRVLQQPRPWRVSVFRPTPTPCW
ncbi:hypothetical protein ACFU9F_32690 [Streptomyces zhihengii]|uniref:hypothetical protein n=1 Tax=Streptomyces zhihengii TaxID=1818004 RepID=UPI0036B30A5B